MSRLKITCVLSNNIQQHSDFFTSMFMRALRTLEHFGGRIIGCSSSTSVRLLIQELSQTSCEARSKTPILLVNINKAGL